MKKRKDEYTKVAAVGMDVHYKFTTVAMRDEKSRLVRRERLDHHDRGQLRQVLSRWPKESRFVMEASFGWGWLADLMEEVGLQPELSNCFKVEKMRKARGEPKTNKRDAGLTSRLPFETDEWWKVWLAPPEVRDRREWMRHRTSLVGVQQSTKNRITAVLHRHGIIHEFSDLFGVGGRKFLDELRREGRVGEVFLPSGAWTALDDLLSLLDHARGQLAAIARELRKQLERTPLAKRLDGIPGFGLILVHTLIAEIGEIERFASHRHLASYSGLAPMASDTGESDGKAPLGRHLPPRVNRTLKWAFIEAAHGAVRTGGRWREMFDAATNNGKKNRGRGYIKVARELVKVVYAMWTKGTEYMDKPPSRPGSKSARSRGRRSQDTRSGTGQFYRPMVPASQA